MEKLVYIFLVCIVAFASMGQNCNNSSPTPTPTPQPMPGFKIRYRNVINTTGGQTDTAAQNDLLTGAVVRDLATNAVGVSFVEIRTTIFGTADVNNGRVPASWRFRADTGVCAGLFSDEFEIRTTGQEQSLFCQYNNTPLPFSVAPNSMDLNALPPTFQINGEGISAQYGMPRISYYNEYGILIGQVEATAVGEDGTWLTANTPDLSQVYTRDYTVIISNAMQDESFKIIGIGSVYLWGRDEPPYDPPSPDEPCYNQNPNTPQMECSDW